MVPLHRGISFHNFLYSDSNGFSEFFGIVLFSDMTYAVTTLTYPLQPNGTAAALTLPDAPLGGPLAGSSVVVHAQAAFATGPVELNGEPWLPSRPLAAGCRAAARGTGVGRAKALHLSDELPHSDCTCGVYAAKNPEHLRQFGYEQCGIRGEVYLWGTVVEHERGWRAQFGYPKSLYLPLDAVPFTLTEIDARLKTLIAFDTDIFIVGDRECIRFWKRGSGFDAAGLDYLIRTREEYYVRRQREHTLKKGDRVAVLGRGIAVVEQPGDKEALVVLGNKLALRIARKDIVLNQQNMRWECDPTGSGQG